jgi:hypothetical protein
MWAAEMEKLPQNCVSSECILVLGTVLLVHAQGLCSAA